MLIEATRKNLKAATYNEYTVNSVNDMLRLCDIPLTLDSLPDQTTTVLPLLYRNEKRILTSIKIPVETLSYIAERMRQEQCNTDESIIFMNHIARMVAMVYVGRKDFINDGIRVERQSYIKNFIDDISAGANNATLAMLCPDIALLVGGSAIISGKITYNDWQERDDWRTLASYRTFTIHSDYGDVEYTIGNNYKINNDGDMVNPAVNKLKELEPYDTFVVVTNDSGEVVSLKPYTFASGCLYVMIARGMYGIIKSKAEQCSYLDELRLSKMLRFAPRYFDIETILDNEGDKLTPSHIAGIRAKVLQLDDDNRTEYGKKPNLYNLWREQLELIPNGNQYILSNSTFYDSLNHAIDDKLREILTPYVFGDSCYSDNEEIEATFYA